MERNKRVLIAFALSFGILLLWRVFVVKEPLKPPPKAPPSQTQTATPSPPAPASRASAKPIRLAVVQGIAEEEVVVEGDLYRITWSTKGAVVKSWILKKYVDQPLDLVDSRASEKLGFPMSLSLADQGLADRLNQAMYASAASEKQLKPPATLEFNFSDGKVQVHKQFTFGQSFEVRAEVSVFDGQNYLPVEVAWLGGFGDHSVPLAMQDALTRAAYGAPDKLDTVTQGKIKEDRTIPGPLILAGLEDRYFVNIFLPESENHFFRLGRRPWTPPEWKEKEPPKPLFAALGSPSPKPLVFRLFVAPKDLDVLRSAKPPLDGLVDFGWFSFVAKPLFLGLRYIHDRWVYNYGWAIVLLTMFINLAMFPLKMKQIRSAQEMQRIAPLVKSIQDKYKQYKFNDPRKQRMNQEVMKLYKEHGINPLGGCLPVLLQLPFLYGFYRVLDLAIELRHAPWILWVKDLSAPDRLHLFGIPLPLLLIGMIVTMFILQKMTPMTTADPAQQRMFMMMPIVFGAMFVNVASGLVLYWLTSNVVQIGQQMFINKFMPAPEPIVATARRPAREKQKE